GGKGKSEGGEGGAASEGRALIGRLGVGFYSAFMGAERVEVISRRAGADAVWLWSSDGKGDFSIAAAAATIAPRRGTRVVLHLMDDAKIYTERPNVERSIREQSGHVPVPIAIVEKPGAAPIEVTEGPALGTKPKGEVAPPDD